MAKRGHLLDSNTYALWRFDEISGVGTAVDVARANNVTYRGSPTAVAGNIYGGFNAREFDGTSAQYIDKSSDAAMATMLTGAWTVEAWVYSDSLASERCIISYAPPTANENSTHNHLIRLSVLATTGYLSMLWETGAGTDVTAVQTTGTGVSAGAWTHVACVKRLNGSTYDVEFYINGVHQQTLSGKTNSSGGSLSQLHIAKDGPSTTTNWDGKIDDMRLSSIARSAAEILDSYEAEIGAVDETIPAVSGVTPAAATELTVDETVQFDVTDSGENLTLSKITVLLRDQDTGAMEVVYFNSAFVDGFQGSTSVITDGFRFTGVIREGGWLAAPQFVVDAFDDFGNRITLANITFALEAIEPKPVIGNVSPSEATELEVDTPVSFDVTDDQGDISRVTVIAHYPSLRAMEVVYFDGEFGPQYTGTCSPSASIYEFTDVIRLGGWPAAPTLITDARDSAGNEAGE